MKTSQPRPLKVRCTVPVVTSTFANLPQTRISSHLDPEFPYDHFAAPLIVPRQELRIMAVLSSTCDGQSVLAFEGLTTSDALSTRAIYFRVNLERILPCLLGVL